MPGEPEISHSALLERVRDRVKDKHVLALVKAFLKAGILSEDGIAHGTRTPARRKAASPSPLLANIALSVLDDYFAELWEDSRVERAKRPSPRRPPNYRLVRYADDFVVMVSGTREHAEAIQSTRSPPLLLRPWGYGSRRRRPALAHIDEGLDFLGWRIQRQDRRGATRDHRVIYTYPSKKALRAIMEKVRAAIRQVGTDLSLGVLLHRLQPCAAGLDQLLPGRSVERHLSIPQRLHLAPSDWLDTTQAPPDHLEATPEPLLLRRMVASRGRGHAVQRGDGADHPLPLPRSHGSPRPGRATHDGTQPPSARTCGEPDARRRARPVRRAVPAGTDRSKDRHRAAGRPYKPDRPPAGQARLHPEAQRPDLPRLPAQGAAPRDLPRRQHRERALTARRAGSKWAPLPTGAVRQTRQTHHRAALKGRGGASAQLVERARFILHLLVWLWWVCPQRGGRGDDDG